MIGGPLVAAAATFGVTFLLEPTYTAKAVILPATPNHADAIATLQSLGNLVGLAGGTGTPRSPSDTYVGLMQSASLLDRLVQTQDLQRVYRAQYRIDARRELSEHTRITVGKKDGFISIEVDDHDPQRSAALANGYIEELRRLSGQLSLSEAKQRRIFFEQQLKQSSEALAQAQRALQETGFTEAALRAEPKAAADLYAKLRAQVTAADARLRAMRNYLKEDAAEFRQAQASLAALRAQLARLPRIDERDADDYVNRYRDFKHFESLVEAFTKQTELARIDESREGPLIQVIDSAQPPERPNRPRRLMLAAVAFAGTAAAIVFALLAAGTLRRRDSGTDPSARNAAMPELH